MCYAVPAVGAIVTSVVWGKTKGVRIGWLNLLFWGGALFGIIDHLWNGELFAVSENISGDLMLGVAITVAILVCWSLMVVINKTKPAPADYAKGKATA